MKLELTEELAATLREMRLTHPVNGKILTAENLSKAIDKNRAWMSQIESRRLKKIKREDIIKLFKLLYNEPDDYRAEYRAETNLTRFILSEQGNNKEIICGGKIDAQYSHEAYKEYREAHGVCLDCRTFRVSFDGFQIVIQSLLPITFFAIGIAQQIIGFIFGTLMVSDEIS